MNLVRAAQSAETGFYFLPMAAGWVKIHRKIMESAGYFSEPFCRNMAWVDLIILANHDDNFFRARGIRIDVKRGQVGYGLDELGRRWKWSRGKVERFLSEIEKDERIVRQKNNVTTLISIVNYKQYQDSDKANVIADDNVKSKPAESQPVKQTVANKNSKKDNKVKKDSRRSPGDDVRPFWNKLIEVWFTVYKLLKGGEEPSFTGRQVSEFAKLYELLHARAKKKGKEWTEDYSTAGLKYFLESAHSDKWLSDHFILENLVKQFDAVFARVNETKKQSAGMPRIPLNDELQYIVDRYSEGELDDRLLTPELYKKMEEKKLIPEGYREKFTAPTPDLQKALAIKEWLEINKKQTA